jgi:hypothetical protein
MLFFALLFFEFVIFISSLKNIECATNSDVNYFIFLMFI